MELKLVKVQNVRKTVVYKKLNMSAPTCKSEGVSAAGECTSDFKEFLKLPDYNYWKT